MTAMTAAKVLDYVNSQQHVLTGLLRDLVAAESPSAHPETHDEIRRILRLALASVGFDSREVGGPDQPRHVFARPAERQRQQPFQLIDLGELDVKHFLVDARIHHLGGQKTLELALLVR